MQFYQSSISIYELDIPVILHTPQQEDLEEEELEIIEKMSLLLGEELRLILEQEEEYCLSQ